MHLVGQPRVDGLGTIREPFFSRAGPIDIRDDSRFFGEPPEAEEMIARMRSMIGHA